MTADESLISIMHRRASLLADTGSGSGASDSGGTGGNTSIEEELAATTEALKAGLAGKPTGIRTLRMETDAELLSRLGRLEEIHPLDDPGDEVELTDRVATDRRCIVLEHPDLEGHPLNVVWVALTVGVPRSISTILGTDRNRIDPSDADSAVFYSIWNVEPGLSGIPGGSALLGLAMDSLRSELPGIETYSTLSPIPGFRAWDESRRARGASPGVGRPDDETLLASCAEYLTQFDASGRLIDPVARFHMRNGARLWRINSDSDRSERGVKRSWGLMANYRYAPEDRDENMARLAGQRPVVGDEVASLLGQAAPVEK